RARASVTPEPGPTPNVRESRLPYAELFTGTDWPAVKCAALTGSGRVDVTDAVVINVLPFATPAPTLICEPLPSVKVPAWQPLRRNWILAVI
ncbi:MAG: hypothetical protein AAF385_12380, partial [Pseudomonadota bacterium]